ncbi:hypothetical protein GN244_ATG10517 [Phytophthora infestans]|uniref:Uncharacterized protein n=1 Tax=Phytophthora infestans TaxID=4787 RepID=A0A833T1E8_PHYIN|nr:hypothetical protein GN244_ATG10517 [Phytophthora infestans]
MVITIYGLFFSLVLCIVLVALYVACVLQPLTDIPLNTEAPQRRKSSNSQVPASVRGHNLLVAFVLDLDSPTISISVSSWAVSIVDVAEFWQRQKRLESLHLIGRCCFSRSFGARHRELGD